MSRFSDLIDRVADQKNYSLSDVLLIAQRFAHRLPGRKFRQWIKSEMDGYDPKDELPDYRVVGSLLIGTYEGWGGARRTKVPISTSLLEDTYRTFFSEQRLIDPVGDIEGLRARPEEHFEQPLDFVFVHYLRDHGERISGLILNQAYKVISKHVLIGVLGSARSRLLDLLLELQDKHPELEQDDSGTVRVTESELETAVARNLFKDCVVLQESNVGDVFKTGQAGAVGPNAKAENMHFIQVLLSGIDGHDLGELAGELETLRGSLLTEAKSAEQVAAVADVAAAEEAAKKGDAKGVLARLKSAGRWAFDVATKIGTTVAAKAIEKSIGLS